MQRLISSSQIPSKLQPKPHPHVLQLDRHEPPKVGSFPPSSRTGCGSGSIRIGLVSSHRRCLHLNGLANPNSELSASSVPFPPGVDVNGNGSSPEPVLVKQKEEAGSNSRKAFTVGKIILLSALSMIVIHPILTSPAFASFPAAAAKTGGSIGRGLLRAEILNSAWTGFFAGCLHTLSGPDHLAALAPLSIGRTRMESAAVGALWGFGHDAGQVIFGLVFLLLKDRLHIEVIKTWGTRVVGLTLLIIGAMGIKEATEVPTPCVSLEDGECDVGVYDSLENPNMGKKKIGFATFMTGIVHGLQPDALMMVLPALALPSRVAGAAFLFMFLVGTVIAMGGYTVLIGSCSQALKDRVPKITEKLTWAASLVAIGLGLAIIISQFFGFTLY